MTHKVVMFGSGRPVTCAIMDYAHRLIAGLNARVPGLASMRLIEPQKPATFIGALAETLRNDDIVHLQLPVEGWGNAILPGSALMAARALTRRGHIVVTLHEWASLNPLRYLSMIPDVLATDQFIFVSPQQRESFLKTPWVSSRRKASAPVIPIGPNIMPKTIDAAVTAGHRARLIGSGSRQADLIIGFFGVLYASKRPELLLQTTRALHDQGVKARLLICGDFLWDKPHDREAFMAAARALDIEAWLDFRGRIDDEAELMATLAASDVFLLPYSDGISARRGSFQAVAQLPIPIVSTLPERADEFSQSPLLSRKIDTAATVLRPVTSGPEDFAKAILEARKNKASAVGVDLSGLWDEAAEAHVRVYEQILKQDLMPSLQGISLPAE